MSDDLPAELPYVLRLYVFWLLDQPEVADWSNVAGQEVGQHIVTDLPADVLAGTVPLDGPWVEVSSYPGRIVEGQSIYWLEETGLQVNCYAGKRHATRNLAETVRRVTVARFRGSVTTSLDEAVVSGVRPGGIHPDLDPRFAGRTVHRARFDLMVAAHPTSQPVGS